MATQQNQSGSAIAQASNQQDAPIVDTDNAPSPSPLLSKPSSSSSQQPKSHHAEESKHGVASYCCNSDHNTLGLRWDDEPNLGGVHPNAERSVEGGVSAITTPELFPVNQIQIPSLEYDPNRPGTAQVMIGGGTSTVSADIVNFAAHIGEITDDDRRYVARKNLEAGMKVLSEKNAAFDIAAMYFAAGRERLCYSDGDNGDGENKKDGWDVDRTTMLALCSEGANASYVSGNFDAMNLLIDEVLNRDDIPIKDKFRVYEVKILAMQGAGNYHASIELGIDVRRRLGLKTPRNRRTSVLRILGGYARTCLALGGKTAEELANLPELTDERIIMGQRILELMEVSCYQAQPTMFALLVFLLMDTSLKYGINASSCDAFTGFGVILCGGFGKPQRGKEMAKVAELILAKPGMKRMTSRSVFVCEGLISHWTKPLRETLEPLLEAYKVGLECGDGQSAGICQSLHVTHSFYCGLPLEGNFAAEIVAPVVGLQNDAKTVESSTVVQTQQDLDIHVIYLLGSKRLRGKEVLPEEQNFDDILEVANKTGNQTLCGYIYAGHMELKVIFGEWEDATNIAIKAGDVRAALVATYTSIRFTFLRALIYIKAAQSQPTGTNELLGRMICSADRYKWKRKALKEMKLIQKWVRRGNVNLVHSLHLLEAELAVLDGNASRKAEESYKSAIAIASKNGFLQDQALSHELASLYFEGRGDDSRRDHHMEHAIQCYSAWGAMAKVAQLNTRRASQTEMDR
eukprot:CAMPEP_0181082736 /NCGR_PEP_ID=MMETSP1071-20121207/3781_1 /TAXON_ID=35127 /ORGANISM="Thalassiosira sp., Strain NH16" /LENGTH=743 /DNA_ID=CAMNT_0023164343 /DNA_START=105 /DNA_END=2336 /DNA_ORIENTATION=+